MSNPIDRLPYREIVLVDFEYISRPGGQPIPVCVTAFELISRRWHRLLADELEYPPFPIDENVLYVAYYAPAEISCHLVLRWPIPPRIFDCYTEFRNLTNGRQHRLGNGLLAAVAAYGLDTMLADEKEAMRDLILSGGPWTPQQKRDILDYNKRDVEALVQLFPLMLDDVLRGDNSCRNLGQALLRGRYMAAIAQMEANGVPIDTKTLTRLRNHWTDIQDNLIAEVDRNYRVYEGQTFKQDRFAEWLARKGI